jgi:hypothetical protein
VSSAVIPRAAVESPARTTSRAVQFYQQADDLALGDEDAKAAQQLHHSRHRRLGLMISGGTDWAGWVNGGVEIVSSGGTMEAIGSPTADRNLSNQPAS